jgi:nucleoside phosphorylase
VTLDVLILAAFEPELAPLRAALGAKLGKSLTDGVAEVGGRRVAARVAGIGLPAAAVGTMTHLGSLEPRAVVLVGSCGAYLRAALSIGQVVTGRRLRLVDPGSLAGTSHLLEPMAVAADADALLAGALEATGARGCVVATTLAITLDDAVGARIAESTGAHIEHLETHGVALACASRGVPFAALLGVANYVGAEGRTQWRAHHGQAEAAAAERALAWLNDGAPGVASVA